MSEPAELLQEISELAADLRELMRAEASRGVRGFPGSSEAMRLPAVEAGPSERAAPTRLEPGPRAPALEPPRRPEPVAAREVPPAREAPPARVAPAPRPAPPPVGADGQTGLFGDSGAWSQFADAPSQAVAVEGPLRPEDIESITGARGLRVAPPPPSPGTRMERGLRGLLAIRQDLGDCTRCRLAGGRNQLVFGMGSPAADLVIVGEGPGFHEDKQGLPFVGASGEMLDRMLENVLGLRRDQVYILNVVKCRPPENRTPADDEVATCSPFLFRQIEAIGPKVILALGAPAVKALTQRTEGINAMRGRWHVWGQGRVPLLATYHPAYLLRKPEDKAKTLADLRMVRARYDELGGAR